MLKKFSILLLVLAILGWAVSALADPIVPSNLNYYAYAYATTFNMTDPDNWHFDTASQDTDYLAPPPASATASVPAEGETMASANASIPDAGSMSGRAEASAPGDSMNGFTSSNGYSDAYQNFYFTTTAPHIKVTFSYDLSASALVPSGSSFTDGSANLDIWIGWSTGEPSNYWVLWKREISVEADEDNPNPASLSETINELIAVVPGREYYLSFDLTFEADTDDSGDHALAQGSVDNFSVSAVPLPPGVLLLGTGLLGLWAVGLRRKNRS